MDSAKLLKEISFKGVRSSGPGGQHVNKTASKAVISFTISTSQIFSSQEKQRLLEKLKHRISQDGILTITCSESRSQHRNKALAIERLISLLEKNLRIAKHRKKSRPSNTFKSLGLSGDVEASLKKLFC